MIRFLLKPGVGAFRVLTSFLLLGSMSWVSVTCDPDSVLLQTPTVEGYCAV